MNTKTQPYIKIGEETSNVDDPTKDEILLDKYEDVEYDSPYIDEVDYDNLLDIGGVIETGSIFDDR